ncbi:hypothetical protein Pla175_39420 [Pirellulimonas nuda]|uniref:LITAF domain-containing protein n=1 Tax=Pirellulimonas nuda TaxID=2528009 RepID=A0A518DGD7_9BACT|nr:hypothetical protein [Pirellulimonas nuda]QDU90536.1 hypothetical protein Pla175_39420 [Pirellulimonas nuda]
MVALRGGAACGLVMAWLLVSCAQTDGAAPTYQRARVGVSGQVGPPQVGQPGRLDRGRWPPNQFPPNQFPPNQRPPGHRPPNQGGNYQAPSIASGTFQRPYPFHLDYYKQKFGGSYDPYFGNLYGPPNVVLATPFVGGSGYFPTTPFPNSPFVQTPQGATEVFCPHCGQSLSTPVEGY